MFTAALSNQHLCSWTLKIKYDSLAPTPAPYMLNYCQYPIGNQENF